ncbi:hypothetical protein ABPG74_006324 [Tetrahymena malaccensis]
MRFQIKDENDIQIAQEDAYELDYLKPPLEAHLINHDSQYIHSVDKKGKHTRRIFYNQEFNEYEKEKIKEFRQLLKDQQIALPTEWSNLKILKCIYNEQFNKKDFINLVKKHIKWLNDFALQNPSEETIEKFLKRGVMYTFGRDNLFRPIVFVNSYMIQGDSNNINDMNAINGALCKLLSTVQKNMFLEGKVENWIICIDTNYCGLSDLDFKVIQKIIECMVANYTCILHKLIILNPSWSFRQCWKIISAFIPSDSQDKIEFITSEEFYKLVEIGISPDQIEKKYGGNHDNLTQYWPPINTFKSHHNHQFSTPSRRESSHYHSMIDHSHFIFSRQDSQREFNDQEITQDGMNFNSKQILEDKQQYNTIDKLVSKDIKIKEESLHQPIDKPYQQTSTGCCSTNQCNIF